jgi:hypothetical protein
LRPELGRAFQKQPPLGRALGAHAKSSLAAQLHASEPVEAARTLLNNENLDEQ